MLIPTYWDISFDFFSLVPPDGEDDVLEATITFSTLTFWLNELMDDLLVYDPSDPFAAEVAKYANNDSMTTPGLPTDELIVKLIHAKLNSIAKDRICVMKTTMSSSDGGGIKYSYVNTEVAEEWGDIDRPESYTYVHSTPWWYRSTAECCDIPVDTSEDRTNVTSIYTSHEPDVLVEYEQSMREQMKITSAAEIIENIAKRYSDKMDDGEIASSNITIMPSKDDVDAIDD
jgi:hypothetical protein